MIDRDPSAHSMPIEPATGVDVLPQELHTENRRLSEELREQRRLADEVETERDEWKDTAAIYVCQRDDARKRVAYLERELGEARRRADALEGDCESWRVQDLERCRTLHTLRRSVETLERELGEARRHLSPPLSDEHAPRVKPYRPRPVVNVKPRPDLLPAEALLEAGACLADRTDRDVAELPWFDRAPLCETLPKYRASLLRHVLAYYADELVDPTSTRATLAHVITNAAILYRLENRAVLAARANDATTSKES